MAAAAHARGRRNLLGRAMGLAMIAGTAAGVAGCGFHLRGTSDMHFETLYSGFSPSSALGEEFRREFLRTTSSRLVEKPDDAQVRLIVMGEVRERDIVASALHRCKWKIYGADGAAALLKVKPTTLVSMIKRLKLVRPQP